MARQIKGNPERENAIYNFILTYKAQYQGNTPTVRELSKQFGLSTSMIAVYLRRLEQRGLIRQSNDYRRTNHILIPGATWTPPRAEVQHAER